MVFEFESVRVMGKGPVQGLPLKCAERSCSLLFTEAAEGCVCKLTSLSQWQVCGCLEKTLVEKDTDLWGRGHSA